MKCYKFSIMIMCGVMSSCMLLGYRKQEDIILPTVSQKEIDDSLAMTVKINESYKAAADELVQDLVGDNLLWAAREVEDSEYSIELEKDKRFYDEGLDDEDIHSISQSLSYYCESNRVKHDYVIIDSVYVNEDGLYITKVDLGTVKLEQVYRKEDKMQRVNYLEGSDEMDKLGIRYDGMSNDDKVKYYAMFEKFVGVEGKEFWSVKELNCCYLLFYIEGDERKLVRVGKDSGEVSHRGTWTEDGEYELLSLYETVEE